MPQIPTSRDIAYANPRSGRIANSGPSVNIGQGLSNLGQGLMQVGFDLEQVRQNEERDNQAKAGYDLELKLAKFRAQEEETFNTAKDQSSESGIGFTRQFIEGYQKRADEFIKQNFAGISEAQNSQARQTILGQANSLYQKANAYETQAKTNYYDRTTNSGLDTIRTQIRSNSAPYEELKRQGLAAINAADMPEPWKAERRALWDADAAESKWRWKFEQNPQEAISQLKAPAGSNVGRAYQRLISKGWAPHQAAGIVGNLMAESGRGLNTQAVNAGDGSDGSDSIGVAQWNGARAKALKDFAAANGTDWHNIDTQIDFIDHELRTSERAAGENLARSTTAEDAAAAFVGYERPAGWSPANARGAMHWEKRRDAALQIAGENPKAEDGTFDSIPYDRREQLANWGETEYSQQRTKERAASVDRYKLLIATEPERVDQNVILNDNALDDGEKASLVTSLKSAMKETGAANAFLGALAQGSVSVNAFDEDQRKIADTAYGKLLGAAQSQEEQQLVTSDFVARTGYVPQKVQAELRYGASSTDPQMMATAMESALVFSNNAPAGFSFSGAEDIGKKADLYRAYTRNMGYSAEEAARKLIDANDPEKAAARETLLKSDAVKEQIKAIGAKTVSAVFDNSFMGFGSDPKLGANPAAEAAMVADYKSIYQEALVDAGGNAEVAKQAASDRFRRTYGVSEFSTLGDTVIRYPVEKTYPAGPDGTHDWVRDQAVRALQGEGVKADEIYLMPLPDGGTEKDVQAGKPARYQILYKDPESGNVEQFNLPFFADPAEAQKQFMDKKAEIRSQSEQRMIENRANDPAGTGVGIETFGNDQRYRGMAREGSPMERAMQNAAQDKRDAAAQQRKNVEQGLQSFSQGRDKVIDALKAMAPRVKIGGYSFGGGN